MIIEEQNATKVITFARTLPSRLSCETCGLVIQDTRESSICVGNHFGMIAILQSVLQMLHCMVNLLDAIF